MRGARLVSVLGPPGMGKSRLARRFAEIAVSERRFPGGVYVCDLAEARSEADLYTMLARVVDGASSDGAARDADVFEIGAVLDARGDSLVVLDEFERLVPCAVGPIGALLRASSCARLLVTSRVRLDLTGEVAHVLGPLTLPEDGRPIDASEAVELFVERARAARPEFSLAEPTGAVVAAVVRELDGIPLAIELCASRMGVLTPSQFLERLPRRLDLLSTRVRDVPERQRTLRSAIGASFEMLARGELEALAQVSVFRGGFDIEAAEAVVDLGANGDAPPLVDVLESLTGKSLVYARRLDGSPGRLRFGLYHGIRDAAAEQLVAMGGDTAAGERHARFFLGLVRSVSRNYIELGRTTHAAHALALEQDNLVAAQAFLSSSPSADAALGALEIALALDAPLSRWGPFELSLSLVDRALAASDALPAAAVARGLLCRGRALRLLGRLDESAATLQRAMNVFTDVDEGLLCQIALERAAVLREQGRLRDSEAMLERTRGWLSNRVEPSTEACVENARGLLATIVGDGERARSLLERAITLANASGLDVQEATARTFLSILDVHEGRLAEAELGIDGTFELAARAPMTLALHHKLRGSLRQEQGALSEARASYEAGISLTRRLGSERWLGVVMGHLGALQAEMGDLAAAKATFSRALELAAKAGDRRSKALFKAALAALCARAGDLPEAERLGAASRTLVTDVGDDLLMFAVETYLVGLTISKAAPGAAASVFFDDEQAKAAMARSFDVRVARRVIARTFESELVPRDGQTNHHAFTRRDPAEEPAARGGVVLVVSPDGRWVRLPNGSEFVFQRGKSLRLVLARLVEARLAAPGRALPMAELFASGWPGERASVEAAQNRVYVAVSRLRKLGLQGLLLSRDDGFLLDPCVPTYRAERPL